MRLRKWRYFLHIISCVNDWYMVKKNFKKLNLSENYFLCIIDHFEGQSNAKLYFNFFFAFFGFAQKNLTIFWFFAKNLNCKEKTAISDSNMKKIFNIFLKSNYAYLLSKSIMQFSKWATHWACPGNQCQFRYIGRFTGSI